MTGRARAAVKTPAKKAAAKKAPPATAGEGRTRKRSLGPGEGTGQKAAPDANHTAPRRSTAKALRARTEPVRSVRPRRRPRRGPRRHATATRSRRRPRRRRRRRTTVRRPRAGQEGRAAGPEGRTRQAGPGPASAGRGADWNARDLAKIRKELIAEIETCRRSTTPRLAELTELQSSSADGRRRRPGRAPAASTFERERELSIAANRFDLLSQMQRAVERIDAGTYGYC